MSFRWLILLALLTLLSGCAIRSYNAANYEACLPELEADRQARQADFFSYTPERFDECRAPARYGD